MIDYVIGLLQKHKSNGILVDTNILLLYFVGLLDPQEIPKFKRTKVFAIEDFYTLAHVLKPFDRVITTPNILTETSNLLGQIGEHHRLNCFTHFAREVILFAESYLPSGSITLMNEFVRFGLTDAGVVGIAKENNCLTITDDFRLSNYLQGIDVDVINFNHIRPLAWNFDS